MSNQGCRLHVVSLGAALLLTLLGGCASSRVPGGQTGAELECRSDTECVEMEGPGFQCAVGFCEPVPAASWSSGALLATTWEGEEAVVWEVLDFGEPRELLRVDAGLASTGTLSLLRAYQSRGILVLMADSFRVGAWTQAWMLDRRRGAVRALPSGPAGELRCGRSGTSWRPVLEVLPSRDVLAGCEVHAPPGSDGLVSASHWLMREGGETTQLQTGPQEVFALATANSDLVFLSVETGIHRRISPTGESSVLPIDPGDSVLLEDPQSGDLLVSGPAGIRWLGLDGELRSVEPVASPFRVTGASASTRADIIAYRGFDEDLDTREQASHVDVRDRRGRRIQSATITESLGSEHQGGASFSHDLSTLLFWQGAAWTRITPEGVSNPAGPGGNYRWLRWSPDDTWIIGRRDCDGARDCFDRIDPETLEATPLSLGSLEPWSVTFRDQPS